jgi:hypothetical protein
LIRNEENILDGFMNLYNPHVIEVEDCDYPYQMWFFGWLEQQCNPGLPGCDAIYTARSKDLKNWEVFCGDGNWGGKEKISSWKAVVLAEDKYFDQWHVGDPSVVLKDGVYYMAYSATGFDKDGIESWIEGDTDGDLSCIRMAKSKDGINWVKAEQPILVYEPEIGKKEDRDALEYVGDFHRPSLMWDESICQWRIWFDYCYSKGNAYHTLAVGHAKCIGDPMKPSDWEITNDLDEPLLVGWPNPDVVKFKGKYHLFSDAWNYEKGEGWTNRQIAEAVSVDGIDWIVMGHYNPDSDAEANHVPEALVLKKDGKERLLVFYTCPVGGKPYVYHYNRIRMLEIER